MLADERGKTARCWGVGTGNADTGRLFHAPQCTLPCVPQEAGAKGREMPRYLCVNKCVVTRKKLTTFRPAGRRKRSAGVSKKDVAEIPEPAEKAEKSL